MSKHKKKSASMGHIRDLSDLPARVEDKALALSPAHEMAGGKGFFKGGGVSEAINSASAIGKKIGLFNNTNILGVVPGQVRWGRAFVLHSTSYDAKGMARELGLTVRRIDDERSVWLAYAPMAGKMSLDTRARFEEGKPADPTENMSPEDAEKWEEMTDKHKDKFKEATKLAKDVARIHMSNLNFDVALLDEGRRVWRGEAQELLHDNDYDPDLEKALFLLSSKRRGDEVLVGGGAGADWVIRRA